MFSKAIPIYIPIVFECESEEVKKALEQVAPFIAKEFEYDFKVRLAKWLGTVEENLDISFSSAVKNRNSSS